MRLACSRLIFSPRAAPHIVDRVILSSQFSCLMSPLIFVRSPGLELRTPLSVESATICKRPHCFAALFLIGGIYTDQPESVDNRRPSSGHKSAIRIREFNKQTKSSSLALFRRAVE